MVRPVGVAMPPRRRDVGFRAEEAGAKHHIGLPHENGFDQLAVIFRVVFEVGILDDHHVAGCDADAGAQGGALAAVAV
jgi:hypothetical protein